MKKSIAGKAAQLSEEAKKNVDTLQVPPPGNGRHTPGSDESSRKDAGQRKVKAAETGRE